MVANITASLNLKSKVMMPCFHKRKLSGEKKMRYIKVTGAEDCKFLVAIEAIQIVTDDPTMLESKDAEFKAAILVGSDSMLRVTETVDEIEAQIILWRKSRENS